MHICTAPDCDKTASRRLSTSPLCGSHYYRVLMDGRPLCSVDGCDRPVKVLAHSLCAKHYHRLCRNGHPLAMHRRECRGICVIDGCDQLDTGPHGLCSKHEARLRRYGDPNSVRDRQFKRGAANHLWRGDNITYRTAHDRIQRAKGPARQYDCVDCQRAPAADWSYNHRDPNEKVDPKTGASYSANPDFYDPRCRTCHIAFDAKRKVA